MKTTARTLERCRAIGMPAGLVERRLPKQFTTVDLFGFIDVVALLPGRVLGIQACGASSDFQNHVRKIDAAPHLKAWLDSGSVLEIWSWRKTRPRGTKLVRWKCRRFRLGTSVESGAREWNEIDDTVH